MTGPGSAALERYGEACWKSSAAAERAAVKPWVAAHRGRRARGERHPVYDFLFEYYSFPPGRLLRYSPGIGRILENGRRDYAGSKAWSPYAGRPDDVWLDPGAVPPRVAATAEWVAKLLAVIGERAGLFGCYGLHEWAMLYRQGIGDRRHRDWPLRVSEAQLEDAVERGALCCTHHDAFRFFTDAARPLNRGQPGPEARLANEQPACLHANMDLYKWSYKLSPWIPSLLLTEAFLLAAEIREVDMRASPYDLAGLGFSPIRIETEHGRAQYERLQRDFAARARPLREAILQECRKISAAIGRG